MASQTQQVTRTLLPLTLLAAVMLKPLPAEQDDPMPAFRQAEAIAQSNNQFAFDLYAHLRSAESENLFLSPASIATALAMTYAGAEGETQKEMARTLRFDLPQEEVHAAFASLMNVLGAADQDTYELLLANRLWGQTDYGFLPEFLATTGKHYGAELGEVDFIQQAEPARQEINAWIEQQTKGRIEDLIPPGAVDSLTRLVLTNAIYFKGKWQHPFDTAETKEAPFQVSAGEQVEVPLMSQKERFRYGETDQLQLLEMAYVGDDLSMLILLPKEVDGLPALEETLTAENLQQWSSGMREQEVQTYIPRFTLTEQFELSSMLSAMGMPSAFDPDQADFSGINGRRDLFISAAIHKAFVDVNEEGTEAAAATGIVVGVTALPPEPKVFRADHPFVFLIQDQRTGSILFMGRVVNPL